MEHESSSLAKLDIGEIICSWPCSSGLFAAFLSSLFIIRSVLRLASASRTRWFITDNLAKAEATSSSASAALALSCQCIAFSVRHCSVSPSCSRAGKLVKSTNSGRTVSMRGRLVRRQLGHRYLTWFSPGCCKIADLPFPVNLLFSRHLAEIKSRRSASSLKAIVQ
jgi:hypothetical protein